MNLTFRLKSLFQRVHGILQELSLVLILILNVLIDFAVLLLLILDKPEQTLVHSDLKLLVIIGELHDLVHCILEVVDDRVIVAKHVPILLNVLLNDPLPHPQILHHEPQTGINRVVLLQLFVHRPGSIAQAGNFELLGRDVLAQIPNFLIQHKLELLQLLGLFLQSQYIPLSLVNDLVLPVNFCLFIEAFTFQLFDILLLFVQLLAFVHNQPI